MKPLLVTIGLVVALAFATPGAKAAEFRSGQTVTIGSGEVINDDLYAGAGDITVDGTVNGDVLASGGQVRINGAVKGNVIASGGQVTINGPVGASVRVAGGQVTINNTVGHDLIVAGGNVEIGSAGSIKGLTKVFGGQLKISGKANTVDASVGTIEVTSGAVIAGNLTYTSDQDAKIDPAAKISGQVTKKPVPAKWNHHENRVGGAIFGILWSTLFAILLLWIFPNLATRTVSDATSALGRSLLWGFLFLVAVPIAALIFFMTIIGFPIGFLLLFIYPIIIGFGKLVAILAVGTWIERWWRKTKEERPSYLAAFLGAIALAILSFIPVIGWFVAFLAFLAGLGAVAHYDWNILTHLRKEKHV